ncbi:MAG: cytidylate kinase-like family protein [Lentisphaerae bacterium]|nr:cytidylate kinase-like family protein [Lentisphaerota bacterium]
MAIITISRGSYSKGREIAEKLAENLGYECVARDVLLEASEQFNVPEIKLVRALHDAPKILDRFTQGKKKYVAYIQEAFLEHVQKDNVVYHGLAGQFFLRGVGHTLKVRVIADLDDRVRLEMERENLTGDKARHVLKKDDYERRKWALALYGIDTADATLYDLVVHIRKISVNDAVGLISHTARLPHFQTTPESQQVLDNLLLAARVKSTIFDAYPDVEVSADNGIVVVHTEGALKQESAICKRIRSHAVGVSGVKEVRVHVRPTSFV